MINRGYRTKNSKINTKNDKYDLVNSLDLRLRGPVANIQIVHRKLMSQRTIGPE